MKIDSAYKYSPASSSSPKLARSPDSSSLQASPTVNLGGSSELRTSGIGEFNVEKVESIKAAIAQGSFSINSSAISERLLTMAKELLAHGN